MDQRIIRLRVELYTAAQTLQGEDAEEFWRLINELKETELLYRQAKEERP